MRTRSLDVMRSKPGIYIVIGIGNVGMVEVDGEGKVYEIRLDDCARDGDLSADGWSVQNIVGILGPFAQAPAPLERRAQTVLDSCPHDAVRRPAGFGTAG